MCIRDRAHSAPFTSESVTEASVSISSAGVRPRKNDDASAPATSSIFSRSCTSSVSYTHLDVYKRQGLLRLRRRAVPALLQQRHEMALAAVAGVNAPGMLRREGVRAASGRLLSLIHI